MSVKSTALQVSMRGNNQIENITQNVQEALAKSGLSAGILTVFIQHTTASVMIIEDEPGIRADTAVVWDRFIPREQTWQHNVRNAGEENGHSHLRGQMQGQSVTIPFNDRVMSLGRWQQIVVIDFDTRARPRDLIVQMVGE